MAKTGMEIIIFSEIFTFNTCMSHMFMSCTYFYTFSLTFPYQLGWVYTKKQDTFLCFLSLAFSPTPT